MKSKTFLDLPILTVDLCESFQEWNTNLRTLPKTNVENSKKYRALQMTDFLRSEAFRFFYDLLENFISLIFLIHFDMK